MLIPSRYHTVIVSKYKLPNKQMKQTQDEAAAEIIFVAEKEENFKGMVDEILKDLNIWLSHILYVLSITNALCPYSLCL